MLPSSNPLLHLRQHLPRLTFPPIRSLRTHQPRQRGQAWHARHHYTKHLLDNRQVRSHHAIIREIAKVDQHRRQHNAGDGTDPREHAAGHETTDDDLPPPRHERAEQERERKDGEREVDERADDYLIHTHILTQQKLLVGPTDRKSEGRARI